MLLQIAVNEHLVNIPGQQHTVAIDTALEYFNQKIKVSSSISGFLNIFFSLFLIPACKKLYRSSIIDDLRIGVVMNVWEKEKSLPKQMNSDYIPYFYSIFSRI